MDYDEIEEKEFTASTMEEAVNKACDYFNVTDKRLKYEVTKSATRGILRSRKTVTIVAKPIPENEISPVGASDSPASEEFKNYALDETNTILNALGLNLKAESLHDGERFTVNIAGPDRMYLMSNDAECLEALQFILNKITISQPGYKKILLDSNGYRDQKEQQLAELARNLARKVKKQRKPYTLEPLNSYERRIIHMALADDDEVTTTSVGEGEFKRITISLN